MKRKRRAATAPTKRPAIAKKPRAVFKTATAAKRKAPPAPRIVGIGASAGGLDALKQFLGNVPSDSGLSFVVVQHQDPAHKSLLSDLLQQATSMRVQVASDQLVVQPNRVYVAPANKDL